MLTNEQQSIHADKAFVYALYPFHLVNAPGGDFYDGIEDNDLMMAGRQEWVKTFVGKLIPYTKQPSRESTSGRVNARPIGDPYRYYDFIQRHFCDSQTASTLEVYELDTQRLLYSGKESAFKNMQVQLGERPHYLGNSEILFKLSGISVLVNPTAALGYVLIGMELNSESGGDVLVELCQVDFFRNIGWRRGQGVFSESGEQFRKHSLSVPDKETGERIHRYSFHSLLTGYLGDFVRHIRFYQDRLTCLYVSSSQEIGNSNEASLKELSFEVLRVPDRNTRKFSHVLTDPAIIRPSRNMMFAGLNEGALVIESVSGNNSLKAVANKYLPAFLLAVNQREVLLKTMNAVTILDTLRLLNMDPGQIRIVEELRNNLTVLQLKQVFYSVSNYQEIETFFNQLQRVFNIELMLRENEQSIREMYNLLETKRKNDEEKYRLIAEEKEENEAEKEESRSRIVNTILGAIGCTGLFSFLKDLIPFFNDTQYDYLYRVITVALPVGLMGWLVWYVFKRRN